MLALNENHDVAEVQTSTVLSFWVHGEEGAVVGTQMQWPLMKVICRLGVEVCRDLRDL